MLSAIADAFKGMGAMMDAAERGAEGGTNAPTTTTITTTALSDGHEDIVAPAPVRKTEGKDEATQTSDAVTSTAAAAVDERYRSYTTAPEKPHKPGAGKTHPHSTPKERS